MPTVPHSNSRIKGAASKQACQRHYVREHQNAMFKRLIADPDYVEGQERCDKDIAWLDHLLDRAGMTKDIAPKKVNPLKSSKRGH